MIKKIGIVAGVVALIVIAGIAYVLRPSEEASAPIEAIPLDLEPTAEVAEVVPTEEPTEEPTETPTPEPTVPEATAVPTDTPAPTDTPTPEPTPTETPVNDYELTIFEISQDASQVRFELDEDLSGQRKTVVGSTNQVAGQIAVDFDEPAATTQIGILQINARTLATDIGNRNRAIHNVILATNTYEFITFEPTAVNNLPDSLTLGEAVEFEIVGNLTIREITEEVTFNVVATPVSATEITGTATTIVARETYGLNIPSVPNVANVENEVELYIDFTALAVQ